MSSQPRLRALRQLLTEHSMSALLVSNPLNITYLSGFTGSSGYLLVTETDAILVTDGRYTVQAAEECPDLTVEITRQRGYLEVLKDLIQHHALSRLAVEGEDLTVTRINLLEERLGETVGLMVTDQLVSQLRLIKDAEEISQIKEAIRVAEEAFLACKPFIRAGVSERTISVELEYAMRKMGAEKLAFETIVASGPNSAKPHHTPGKRVLEKGDLVTVDWGAQVDGYCSDLTRTFGIGKVPSKQVEQYNLVLEAQQRAIAGLKPGVTGQEADSLARSLFEEHNYAEAFNHSLGHSLGKEVHDGPGLSASSNILVLAPGMVMTVEPGLYIEGKGGIRIEDDVLITKNGHEVLSHLPTAWEVL